MGGLGNVLFQLNKAFELEQKGYKVFVSTLLFQRSWLLSKILGWSDHGTLGTLKELGLMSNFDKFQGSTIDLILLFISKKTNKCIFSRKYVGHHEENQQCSVLMGYFSSEAVIGENFSTYVKDCLNLVKESRYRFTSSLTKTLEESVVLHFRGGDYFDNNVFTQAQYYNQIISKHSSIAVVTNDNKRFEEYMLNNFPNNKYQIISNGDMIHDFFVLMSAKKIACANSTFSWWAAELGESEIVFEPKIYFNHLQQWSPRSNKQREKI